MSARHRGPYRRFQLDFENGTVHVRDSNGNVTHDVSLHDYGEIEQERLALFGLAAWIRQAGVERGIESLQRGDGPGVDPRQNSGLRAWREAYARALVEEGREKEINVARQIAVKMTRHEMSRVKSHPRVSAIHAQITGKTVKL